jgi:hypothetical protein
MRKDGGRLIVPPRLTRVEHSLKVEMTPAIEATNFWIETTNFWIENKNFYSRAGISNAKRQKF